MKRALQTGNILALVFALVANFLVGAQILALPSINEISDKYASVLTPATYAFSIWSLIYTLLVLFVIYQARDLFKPRKENTLPERVGPWFIIASICNGLWTYVFVNEWIALSVIILLVLTVSLYIVLWRLRIALDNTSAKTIGFVWWPLMLYTGWVTVASVVNIASWFTSIGFPISPLVASIILVLLTVALLVLLITRNTRELLLACIWGITAIGSLQMQSEATQLVGIAAFTVASMLLIAVAIHAFANVRSNEIVKASR